MSTRADTDRIKDAHDSIKILLGYLDGRTLEDIEGNQMLYDAIVHRAAMVGEALSKTSDLYKERHSDIDWSGIIGFRAVLVHDYYKLNIARVVSTIKNEMPKLLEVIAKETEK
jgi:uncharacterized protein with HEPN domain